MKEYLVTEKGLREMITHYADGTETSYPTFGAPIATNIKPGERVYSEDELNFVCQYFDGRKDKWFDIELMADVKEYADLGWQTRQFATLKEQPKDVSVIPNAYIQGVNGKEYPISNVRSQGGLKKDIIELTLNLASPDDDCMLSDFLHSLQFVLDKHDLISRKAVIEAIEQVFSFTVKRDGSQAKQLITLINNIK